ncbi:JAB domain-containing protein [Mucilaginibacter pedocola]|uniref:MPN domain-containing protein n=1 Tax=Mucilaginibacter pedocola TaxID=1792845 RepID=A0A1S9P8Y4_9SPHI|nr:JAB domain-containing protein [Mucilaginibacter pedocola]OOQ57405.1 hypothetical protein BC343_15010 [Mucilaginibacter pedocola]
MKNKLKNIPFNVAEIELVYKNQVDPKMRPIVTSSKNAHAVFRAVWDDNRIDLVEEFKIILLAQNNTVIGVSNIATGSTTQCLADPKIVFGICLKSNAAGICLAHNHPSGNTAASPSDISLTHKFCEGARIFGIKVWDHIIITRHGYSSMNDDALMPNFD